MMRLAGATALVALAANGAPAQEWEYRLTPYVWFPTFESSYQSGDSPDGEDSSSFWDIFQGGFLLFGEARRGDLAFLGEFNVLTLGDDVGVGSVTSVEIGLDGTMVSAVASWTALRSNSGRFDLIAGARAWDVTLGAEFPPVLSYSVPVQWVDPIVGVAGRYDFSDRWSLEGRADIGGFGVGSQV